MRKYLLLLLLCFGIKTMHAQVYTIKNFTTADGLINNRASTVNQDGEGYIWIGTDNGICRYDGKKIKYFPLPGIDRYVFTPASRRYKKWVLISTTYGVALCCGDSIITYNVHNGKPGLPVESLALNDSTFLFTDVNEGFFKIEKNSSTKINIDHSLLDYPLALYKDAYGNIWLGCSVKTIFYKNGDLSKPKTFPALAGIYINTIKEDAAQNLYFVTEKGIFRIKKEDLGDPFAKPPVQLYAEHRNILSALAFDRSGHAWVSNTFGVLRFSDDFARHELITPENGVASYNAWDAFCDRENNLWFPTENGVNLLINKSVISYSFPPNEFPSIKSGLVWNDSTFYYTNGTAINKLVNGKVIKMNGFADDPGYMEERLWKTPDNKLWLNYNIIRKELNDGHYTEQVTDVNNTIVKNKAVKATINKYGYADAKTMYNDDAGNMWFATDARNLGLYKNGKVYSYKINNGAGDAARVNHIAKDKFGYLWLACRRRLIRCSIAPEGDTFRIAPVSYTDSSNGLNTQGYYKIFCDSKNRIWTGGSQGVLAQLSMDKTGKVTGLKQYRVPQISGGIITDFTEADNGDIWVGTNLGIDIISTDAIGRISIRKDAYGTELCGKYIFFIRKQLQKMYVGTTGCMAVIDLAEKKLTAPPPHVFITDIKVGNAVSGNFLQAANYRLSPDSNTVSFYFNATSFLNGGVKYKYMLEGADKDWSSATGSDNITYSQLQPGSYIFKVMAQNSDGVWSEYAAQKSFTINRPFYTTPGFYFLCAALFFLSVYLIYRYRLNEIKRLHTIRTNISNDLHDDIGSTLSSITMMSNLVKQKIASDPVQSAAIASQIEESGRQMIYAMSDIVWSIKPGNDTLEQLINRLREYMNIMLESTVDDYALIADENISDRNINMYLRRDIYLICKEIIHNTAKYAAAKKLIMRISIEGGRVHIRSEDNGKGFDLATVKKGNGLQNIFMRIKTNKGAVQCDTAPGSGTVWTINIPL